MLPIFRQPIALPARARAMPDLFDRTRIALVAVLASFAALGLALVVHLAATGAPLPLPGLSGQGQVITTGEGAPGNPAGSADRALDGGASPASATSAALAPSATTGGGDRDAGRGPGPAAQNGGGAEPRQIEVSIGSQPPAPPPAAPQAPGTTTAPGTGNPGTGTSGTGGEGEDTAGTPGGSGTAGEDYGHAPVTTTPSVRGGKKSATSTGTSSVTSGRTSDATKTTSSSYTTSSQTSYKGKTWSKSGSGTAAAGTTSSKPSYAVGGSSGSFKSPLSSKRSG